MSEEKKIWYYAQITDDNICCGVSQLSGVVEADNMIELESYDTSLIGKMWAGGEWVENPNPPEPPEPSHEPTTQDIMDELKAMQGDQVPAAKLDSAYREGVNAYV